MIKRKATSAGRQITPSLHRGSALVYVLIIVASTSVAVIALVGFSSQSYRRQVSAERKLAVQYAFEGAVAQIRSEEKRGLSLVATSKTITIGSISTAVSVTDNSATLANTHRVDLTATAQGASYARSYVIGVGSQDSLYNYAIAIKLQDVFNHPVITSNSGSMYGGADLVVNSAGSSVAGNLKLVGALSGSSTVAVAGTKTTGATALTFPTINSANYLAAADTYYGSSTTFSGGTPPTPYYLVYVKGNVQLNSGSYGGKSILFCTGTVTINGTMTYANSSSQLVVIALGDMYDSGSGSTAVGTYYIEGNIHDANPFAISRGSVVNKSTTFSDTFTVTFDPYFKINPSEMANFMLPGYWP